jgi:hypothetical protein
MANRYWVGGTGTWDTSSTTNWSATSNGASGASAPTSADDVFIDTSSGTGTITCTSAVCNNLTVTASQAISLGAAASTLSIYGSLSMPSGGSFSANANNWTLTFAATSTGKTITTNGKLLNTITFNGVGGGWTLQDNLNLGDRTLTLTNGSFNANNFNVTCGSFTGSGSSTRTLTMGSGTWTLSDTGTAWNLATTTNLTFNAGTSTIALSNTTNFSKTFNGGGLTYYNLSISATTGSAIYIFTGANTFNQISSSKTVQYRITLPSSTTTTVGTWTASGSSGNLLTLNSSSAGTATTIAATNPFTVNYGAITDVNLSATLIGTAANSLLINSNNWQIATTSTRWLNPLITATNYNTITTPSDWPTTAVSNIYVIGGGGGGAGGVSNNLAGGAGGGGGGYALLANTTLAASTSYTYKVGAGGTGTAGGSTTQTGGTGGTTAWNIAQNTISFVASVASVRNTASSTIIVTVPTVSNGNLMVMICQATNTGNTFTTPTGWTIGTASVQGRVVFWKIASSEPGTYTVTMSSSDTANAFILTYSNASFDTSGLASQSNATPIQPVAITVAAPNSRVVYVTFRDGASTTFTTPTGYTARAFDSDATSPSGATFDIANIAAGTYTAPTSTPSGGSSGKGFVIALSPTTTAGTVSATGGAGGTSTTTPTSTGGAGGTGSTINYIASAQTQTVSSSTTLTINVPTGTANGDLMVAMVLTSASTSATWTTPAGWTAAVTSSSARGVYYRTASSEPASYTFTASGSGTSQGYIFTYRNAQFDVSSAITTNSNPTVTASITTTANNAILLYYAGLSTNASETYTAPTGFSTLATDSDATAPSSAVFYKLQTAAGATGTVSCTGSTTNNRAVILAIKPILNGNGGTGGAGAIAGTKRAGGGGGGAGGPNGNGGNGGVGFNSTNSGGGGGGGNGGGTVGAAGTNSAGGTGGNNSLGTGGGTTNTAGTLGGGGGGGWVNGGGSGAIGTAGGNGVDIIVGLYGSGGGAGGAGSNFNAGGTGGLYGGGGSGASIDGTTLRTGGPGAQGAIFVGYTGTYVPSVSTGNFFFLFM